MSDLVVVKRFFHKHEAEVGKGILEHEGIRAMVSSDDLGGFRPHLTYSTGNVRLLVNEADLDKAKEALKVLEIEDGKIEY